MSSPVDANPDSPAERLAYGRWKYERPDSGAVSVNVGEGGNRVRLKPGETLDRGNGQVRDVIGEGEIQVRRSPATP